MKKKINFLNKLVLHSVLLFMLGNFDCLAQNKVPALSIVSDKAPGISVSHGLGKLMKQLQSNNISFEKVKSLDKARGSVVIVAGLSSGSGPAAQLLKAGSFSVAEVAEGLIIRKTNWKNKTTWLISGFDQRGLMYGLLEVANQIRWSVDQKDPMKEVKEVTEKPAVAERAISIYTMNRAYWESRFFDEAYWTKYLDVLAENRFNSLVVIFGYENGGFLAPAYPYFFDVSEFPDVKMIGITKKEQERNLLALNRLIEMAHDRNIRFSVGIWDHIYRGGVQGGGIPGTKDAPDKPLPGLVWGVNEKNLIPYNRTALAKFIRLVPHLDGIQFRMHNESGLEHGEQESFWSDVFKMVKQSSPGLRLDLRAKELPESVIQSAIDIGVNFRIATKYWMEQMGMPYHPTKINPEKSPIRHSYSSLLRYPKTYKMHWRLWNGGTSRILLWGSPDYVRRFVESTHLYDGDGFEVNEPLATKMEAQPHDATPFELLNSKYKYYEWEFERYWHFFQLFGRLGYNPETSPDIWKKEFEMRFGKMAGPIIETALHKASWILPRIISSSYPYRLFPTTRGWAEKQRLGDLPSFARAELSDMQQFASFDEEAKMLIENGETAKIRPSANSQWFQQVSRELDQLIAEAESSIGISQSKEFISTITDTKILSKLALYHSKRIPAAVSYCMFQRTNDKAALENAIAYESEAVAAWQQIVDAAGDVYNDNLMLGVCVADLCGHWKDELALLQKGLEGLKQKLSGLKATGTGKIPTNYAALVTTNTGSNLFQISHNSVDSALIGKPLKISAKVSAPAGIKWVRLLYRGVNQEQDYQAVQMHLTKENELYEASIPTDQIDPKWDLMYLIQVMDNIGNGKTYPDLNKETPYKIVKLIR